MILSLLIPTLASRSASYARLRAELERQIDEAGGEVEIVAISDNGERAIGAKRNQLLQHATGTFVAFIDDDDDVSPVYVSLILGALRREPHVDCVAIKLEIDFRGHHRAEAIHSVRYSDLSSRDGKYYRPPYILNPIRREIALRYPFAEVRYAEDFDWALRMARDGALRDEATVDAVLYHYHSRRYWAYQRLLDVTEPLRHRLGLRADRMVRHS